jgi:peptide methionine sulfoxide reductase msrA/msrB
MKLNPLTPEEKRIIEDKGTEATYSGEYEKFFVPGVFTCRRCGALLYRSEDKFDAHCGWPSFDREVAGAVTRMPDTDGTRTEITCARCGAHLGHVFVGEEMTPKNTRHCVNSLSLKFVAKKEMEEKREIAYFGGGCFWCTEAVFKKLKGVLAAAPGYAGGAKDNPTYEEVSSGATGHAEAVRVEFDPAQISYEALLSVFFATHDPTTPNRQGADIGSQYRSLILYDNDLHREIAEKFIRNLEAEKIYAAPIVTELKPLQKFHPAEEYHRDYFAKNPAAAYCQAVINPKLKKLREKFTEYLQ